MKLYEGTKRLRAKPMTRGEYNEYRGWDIPADESPEDAGYLVEYEDGGRANDSRHIGYISWSPADVFERTYKPVLQPYQQRVIEEKAALDIKLEALRALFQTPMFAGWDRDEAERLLKQEAFMLSYSNVLAERIAAF